MFEQLKKRYDEIADRSILSLFDTAERAKDYRCQLGEMVFDYSKTNIGAEERTALIDLLQIRDVAGRARAMFSGEMINQTEERAVLHTALRNLDGGSVMVAGSDVMPEVRKSLERMAEFANTLRSGAYRTAPRRPARRPAAAGEAAPAAARRCGRPGGRRSAWWRKWWPHRPDNYRSSSHGSSP